MSEICVTNEVRNIDAITAEIIALKQDAGNAILAIGERLIEAKNMLDHGQWCAWLSEKVEFSERTAQRFMRLAKEWRNPSALSDLGATKALALLALPAEERERFITEFHVVDGEEKSVGEMTTRELETAVRERDAARLEAEKARAEAQSAGEIRAKMEADMNALKACFQSAQEELETARAELKRLRDQPVDVAVEQVVDQEAIDRARAEAVAGMQEKVDRAEAALADAKEKLAAAEKRMNVPVDKDLATFELLFDQAQDIANKLRGFLLKAKDPAQAAGMQRALTVLADLIRKAAQA